MRLSGGRHLGYCTNVHPYDDVAGMLEALATHAVPLRRALGLSGPLGVGLWFPEPVARQVASAPATLAAELERMGLYVFTLNAFPQGAFHGDRVKDAVFRPSWAEPSRLDYTLTAAEALAGLLPEGEAGTISTHSGAYKPWGPEANDEDAIAAGLLAAADGLAAVEARTGRRIVLALEPEPLSFLETTAEVVDFFERRLLAAGDAARTHLGLCYDACHQAVEHEDMAASVAALRAAGVPVAKVQLSSAIVVPEPRCDAGRLAPFAEDRWFHQVVTRTPGGGLRRFADLPEALADPSAAGDAPWRVHYHVPLFADPLDDEGRIRTTRPWLEELVGVLKDGEVTAHLEVETYTFAAIPAERRRALGAGTLGACLERELRWALDRLGEDPVQDG